MIIQTEADVSLRSRVFELTEDWFEVCAEMRYELDYEADNSLHDGNGYIGMDINVTGLCNVRKQFNLRETQRNGNIVCTIKTNETRHIVVRFFFCGSRLIIL